MKIHHLINIISLGLFVLLNVCHAAPKPFSELIFIDHENLRYVEDEELTSFQVNEIKRNINQAVESGVNGYLLFAKETMEAMLTYDFVAEGIGNIGKQAFPPDSEHRVRAERLRQALREVMNYAKQNNIKLYFHSNQFIFADEVLDLIKDNPGVWGSAVCPGREATWNIYRGKINEFCSMFPDLAGLQITGDETQVSVLSCDCDQCRSIDFSERVRMLTNATAEMANQYGMEVQMRTWQRMDGLGDPGRMNEGVLDNVYFSIKNTDGDFRLEHGLDEKFLTAAVPERIVCEFDAWREYTGHNYFPCYMGSVWAPRFAFIKEKNIPRIAVRLMWNSNKNPIFEKPWGNSINIYAFLKLSKNPHMNSEKILQQFVEEFYPASARQAAIELYDYSLDFQQTMYYINGKHYSADHARVQDEDAKNDLEDAQEEGFLTRREDFSTRRFRIKQAFNKAVSLVEQLGDEVPAEWKDNLIDGARIQHYVALSNTDKMEMFYLIQQQYAGETVDDVIAEVKQRMEIRASDWEAWDADSFDYMQGDDVFEHWILMSPESRKILMHAVKHEFPGAANVEIEEDESIYRVDGETAEGREFLLQITPEGKVTAWRLEMSLEELPPAVQAAIQNELEQGGSLDERMHCKENGEEFFEVEIDRDDAELQLKISFDGEILKKEWD